MKKTGKKIVSRKKAGFKMGKTGVGKKVVVSVFKKAEKPVGVVTHYYTSIKVGIVKFKKDVKKGVIISFHGATTGFSQKIESLQLDHKAVAVAKKGKLVGIKLKKRVREGDEVFLGKN